MCRFQALPVSYIATVHNCSVASLSASAMNGDGPLGNSAAVLLCASPLGNASGGGGASAGGASCGGKDSDVASGKEATILA